MGLLLFVRSLQVTSTWILFTGCVLHFVAQRRRLPCSLTHLEQYEWDIVGRLAYIQSAGPNQVFLDVYTSRKPPLLWKSRLTDDIVFVEAQLGSGKLLWQEKSFFFLFLELTGMGM